jgi:Tol biopolymer transport system component
MSGLYLVAVDGTSTRKLTEDAGAGVHARWTGADAVQYHAVHGGVQRDLLVDRAGRVSLIASPATAHVGYTRDDRMYVVDRSGTVTRIGTGDRFFGAVASPDGDRIAFQGLSTGIYVYTRSTGVLQHVGPGTAPSWSPDGSRLVFEVTEDDGHEIVASDLYLYEVQADRVARLTSTDATVERRPSFSPDGTGVAFDDDRGAILVGQISTTEGVR